jgi:hypothetical protein
MARRAPRRAAQPVPVQVLGVLDLLTALAGIIVRATASDASGRNLGYGLIGAAFLSALILVPVLQWLCRPRSRGRTGALPGRDGQAVPATDAKALGWRFGSGPDQLFLSMARPPDWEAFDVLAALSQPRPDPLATEVLYGLGLACRSADVFAITGMVSKASKNLLTWCLALGFGPGLQPELERGDGEPVDLTAGPARRIRATREITLLQDRPPVPVYTERYLVRTEFGPLAVTFLTPHPDGSDVFEGLFGRLAATCQLTRTTASLPTSAT